MTPSSRGAMLFQAGCGGGCCFISNHSPNKAKSAEHHQAVIRQHMSPAKVQGRTEAQMKLGEISCGTGRGRLDRSWAFGCE